MSSGPPTSRRQVASAAKPEVLTLTYDLSELPSSQHRAGLAGLVLVMRWLDRQSGERRGVRELTRVDQAGATLRLDQEGLKVLFDEIYAAAMEEREWPQLRKKKNKEVVPPLREITRTLIDPKTGKSRERTYYVYADPVPRGSFLADIDGNGAGRSGLWIKLWRDMLWNVFRGVPATRHPYDARAAGEEPDDAAETWQGLLQDGTTDLPSTYFVGAQAATAENVPFKDRARYRVLLHFWPFAASIYCPVVIDHEGKRDPIGYALAIPDVADLEAYCEELPEILRNRSDERWGYRPREAIVDLALESGLDFLRLFAARLEAIEGRRSIADVLLGVDVVHVDKEGNNVRVLGSTRVDPDLRMLDEYTRVRDAYWDSTFRHQRVINLVASRPWFYSFDRLFRTLPQARTIESKLFRHDAREAFTRMEAKVSEESKGEVAASTIEAQIYRIVGNYISRRLESKHRLRWDQVKDQPKLKAEYEAAREKVAKDAFLAIRSRSGADFVDYFTGTLCSVPQHVGEEGYLSMTRALLADPATVRTLTLLALSARG